MCQLRGLGAHGGTAARHAFITYNNQLRCNSGVHLVTQTAYMCRTSFLSRTSTLDLTLSN
jgi:hypothetical protein